MSHFLERLAGGIWHTTHPERFPSIMAAGLKAQPDVPDAERWKTARGPEFFPFVRHLGGVSLFDFRNFDPVAYDLSHPMSSWREFVPHREVWGGAIWIEICPSTLGSSFVSADELARQWDEGGYHRHAIMPRIECACLGDVPMSAFKSAFAVWKRGKELRDMPVADFDEGVYNSVMEEWSASMSGDDAKPAKSPFDELQIDKALVCEFFGVFARFEYAMKATSYLGADRHDNAKPDWNRLKTQLGKLISETRNEEIDRAVAYLVGDPPQVQKVVSGNAQFQALELKGDTAGERAIEAAGRVRNNLFHGGKHTPHSAPGRDVHLVKSALEILRACLAVDSSLRTEFEHQLI